MPRAVGQIDQAKNEAILDAAAMAMSERGMGVSIDEIARRAGVSKQTIYNHYGSKADLVRALVERRVEQLTAPLRQPGAIEDPEAALAAFARVLLATAIAPKNCSVVKVIIQSSGEMPEIGRAFYEAGPMRAKAALAAFLAQETKEGRLDVDNPQRAAEFFSGMVAGPRQMRMLLTGTRISDEEAEAVAVEAARRFMRAYAPG